jgi:glucose/arabinose dehydrogenase
VQALGSNPTIPTARPQGSIPTLKMPTARGWTQGQKPVAADGLRVNAFATGLKHPRWIQLLPNGDVLTAEALFMPDAAKSIFDYAMTSTMKRAAAVGVSPNRITLLRDADGDGVAETQERFLEGQSQPFGMALLGDTFYLGNTDGLVAFPYVTGAKRITAPSASSPASSPAGRTRSLLPSPDGQKLYVGVGSSPIRRQRHGSRRGPRRHLRVRSGKRPEPHLRRGPAQSRGAGMGAEYRCALDGGQ